MNDDEATDAKAVGRPGGPSTKQPTEPATASGDGATSKPQAELATETAEAAPVPSRPRPMWQRVALLLLPPVLAAAAAWAHWKLNVPDRIRESPNDQGAKKPRSAKAEKDDKDRAARARRGRNAQRAEPRSQDELDRDWARFAAVPFDEEPTRADWARRHQAIINRAVVVARREAFDGAPERPQVVLVDTTCRTVRCRLLLRSPNAHELEMVGAVLQQLRTGGGTEEEPEGEPVWRSYELQPAEAPADAAEPSAEHYVQITVAFNTDETNTRGLTIPTDDEDGEDDEDHASGDPPTEVDGA